MGVANSMVDTIIETPTRKQLKRDLDREALDRLEGAARTAEEFEVVNREWDRLDRNRERRERYYEQLVTNAMFDWDFRDMVTYDEDLLNIIFRCICQMHLLTANPKLSRLVDKATDKQKAVFFTRYILGCSVAKIAACHGMTERNVRKLIATMIKNIHDGLQR